MVKENFNYSYDSTIEQYPLLSSEEEQELFLILREKGSSEIRKKIIYSNFRLVIDICSNYRHILINPSLFSEMIEEGVEGLILAVDSFDISKNNKFSTYATWKIKRQVVNFIYSENYLCVPQPYRFDTDRKLYNKVVGEFSKEYGRKPSCEEISSMTNFTIDRIKFIENYCASFSSLDASFSNENPICLSEMIADSASIDDECDNSDLRRIYFSILDSMDIKESSKEMFIMRFGLDGRGGAGLKEIAKIYGISHQAVGQNIDKILKRIAKSYSYLFEEYISDDKIKSKIY